MNNSILKENFTDTMMESYLRMTKIFLVMKVTALIPDELIDEIKKLTGGQISPKPYHCLNDYIARQESV